VYVGLLENAQFLINCNQLDRIASNTCFDVSPSLEREKFGTRAILLGQGWNEAPDFTIHLQDDINFSGMKIRCLNSDSWVSFVSSERYISKFRLTPRTRDVDILVQCIGSSTGVSQVKPDQQGVVDFEAYRTGKFDLHVFSSFVYPPLRLKGRPINSSSSVMGGVIPIEKNNKKGINFEELQLMAMVLKVSFFNKGKPLQNALVQGQFYSDYDDVTNTQGEKDGMKVWEI